MATVSNNSITVRPRSLRRTVTTVHSWAGAVTFLIVFLVAVSGVLSAFAGDLLRWQYGAIVAHPAPPPEADYVDMSELLITAKDAYGRPFEPLGLFTENSRFSIDTTIIYGMTSGDDGEPTLIGLSVDPYRGQYLGFFDISTAWTNYVVHFHDSLLLGEGGRITVTIIGILLLIFTLTGIYQWWPRRGRVVSKATSFRLEGNTYAKMFKLHGLLGLWLAPLIMLWSFTGAYIAEPDWFGNFLPEPPRQHPASKSPEFNQACGDGAVTFSQAYMMAQTRFPGRRMTLAQLPNLKAETPVYQFNFIKEGDLDKHAGDARAWVSQTCADNVLVDQTSKSDVRAALGAMIFSLHTGRSFGPLRLPLTILTGLVLAVLSVAGLYVWWRKHFPRKPLN